MSHVIFTMLLLFAAFGPKIRETFKKVTEGWEWMQRWREKRSSEPSDES